MALAPDGVVFDAGAITQQSLPGYVAEAATAHAGVYVDPVNYLDQSPPAARPVLYQALPYGGRARLSAPPAGPGLDTYVEPIVDYQLDRSPTAVIAPYFFAEATGLAWFDASLDAAVSAEKRVNANGLNMEVWTGVAIAGAALTTSAARMPFLKRLQQRKPQTVYLLVAATQATAAPLADEEVIDGLKATIDTVNGYGGRVILGRRYVSGYLGLALGAAGWSTGMSGTHQNFPPPPLKKEDGGLGADWIFLPPLLNSLRLSTRAALASTHPGITAPSDQYDAALFKGVPALTSLSIAQRIMLHRHNLLALRQLGAAISQLPAAQRRLAAKAVVQSAKANYATITRAWVAGEQPDFLDAWEKAL